MPRPPDADSPATAALQRFAAECLLGGEPLPALNALGTAAAPSAQALRGIALAQLREFAAARAELAAAVAAFARTGAATAAATALAAAGEVAAAQRDFGAADRLLGRASTLLPRCGDPRNAAWTLAVHARLRALAGDARCRPAARPRRARAAARRRCQPRGGAGPGARRPRPRPRRCGSGGTVAAARRDAARPPHRAGAGRRSRRRGGAVGSFRGRSITKIDPTDSRVVAEIASDRLVTGVTFCAGQLWHGTWPEAESAAEPGELGQIDAASGAVRRRLHLPAGTHISGTESDGKDRIWFGNENGARHTLCAIDRRD